MSGSFYKLYGKRLFDAGAAVLLIVVLFPLLLLIAAVVYISLGNPVIFTQVRPGRHGRPFRLRKFRTMTDRRDSAGALLADEQRLTPIGRWLRSTSLDELPELWNVLRGEMSLVGPRPLLMQYLEHYSPQQHSRHDVLPGITGLAQVSGRNRLSLAKKLNYDIKYVASVSFFSDVSILARTVLSVIKRDGTDPNPCANPTIAIHAATGEHACPPRACEGLMRAGRAIEPWPAFDAEQITAVANVLSSGKVNYWTGTECTLFEKEYADSLGLKHAVAVNNGTVALELALYALGIGVGDEVIVPSRTFIATASAVVACGATPVVTDIDAESQTLSIDAVRHAITDRTRAVIAVHLGGWPCDMDALLELANSRGVAVVEDCAQAHGATYKGRPIGSFGAISAFSFCQDKIISTGGEGGLVATNNTRLWERVWSRKDHGKDFVLSHQASHTGAFRFLHKEFGTNARMTEMQAALGRIQLRRLDNSLASRRRNASYLVHALSGIAALRFPNPPSYIQPAYYRLYGFVDPTDVASPIDRDSVLRELVRRGVPVGCGSSGEIFRERAFETAGRVCNCPNGSRLNKTSLAFCVHPTLTPASMEYIATAVLDCFEKYGYKPGQQRAA